MSWFNYGKLLKPFCFYFCAATTTHKKDDFALTCSMAGVSEAVGREGLQRFMGEKSEVVTSRVGGLICKTLGGFLVFPELWALSVVLLLTELVSVLSTKLVSSPEKERTRSPCWKHKDITVSLFFTSECLYVAEREEERDPIQLWH